jgi:formamidopyrimidine-DNA glycosylase (fpg)
MPELPEVETVVRGLKEQIIGQEIQSINIRYAPMLHTDKEFFQSNVLYQKIIDVQRFGKYILIVLANNKVIRVHLRMEGKFFITEQEQDDSLDKHVHIILKLGENRYLKYHDVRKFGTFELIERQNNWHNDSKFQLLGYEPWEQAFTTAGFYQKLHKSTKMIKPFLLDQKTIVGLGNIYVDEVLFLSAIHPEKRAKTITKKQAQALKDNAITVLNKAISLGGSTIRTYHNTLGIDGLFQNELNVHLQKDQPCPNCQTPIIKIKVGGRGSYLCPKCQRK